MGAAATGALPASKNVTTQLEVSPACMLVGVHVNVEVAAGVPRISTVTVVENGVVSDNVPVTVNESPTDNVLVSMLTTSAIIVELTVAPVNVTGPKSPALKAMTALLSFGVIVHEMPAAAFV